MPAPKTVWSASATVPGCGLCPNLFTLLITPQVGNAGPKEGLVQFGNGSRVWTAGPMGDDFEGTRLRDPWLPELRCEGGGNIAEVGRGPLCDGSDRFREHVA